MFKFCPTCKSSNLSFKKSHYWECEDCDFLYYHNIASSVAGIIEYNGSILLTKRAKEPGMNKLDLPGGFVDPNESLEQAISREVYEELKLTIKNWSYLNSYPNIYKYGNIEYRTLDSIFFTKLDYLPKLELEQPEILQTQWLTPDEIVFKNISFNSIRQGVKNYIRHSVQCILI